MEKSKSHIFDSTEGTDLINIQYGVCFGAIFVLLFDREYGKLSLHLMVNTSLDYLVPFLFLLTYFFMDWLTANFVRSKIKFNFVLMLSWSLTIWFLGALVILSNGEEFVKFIMLASYAIIVGIYHFLTYFTKLYSMSPISKIWGGVISAILVMIGIFFLYQTIVSYLNSFLLNDNIQLRFCFVVIGMILLKCFSVFNIYKNVESKIPI